MNINSIIYEEILIKEKISLIVVKKDKIIKYSKYLKELFEVDQELEDLNNFINILEKKISKVSIKEIKEIKEKINQNEKLENIIKIDDSIYEINGDIIDELYYLTLKEVTQNYHLNKEIRKVNEVLERKNKELEETNEQIEVSKEDIEEKYKENLKLTKIKDDFLTNVSHDIRTPLNGILGLSNILYEKDELTKEERKEKIKLIIDTTKDLNKLLNDVLDVSKMEDKNFKMINEDFNLYKMIEKIKNQYEEEIENKKLKLNINIDKKVPEYIKSDELRLNQVLSNIVSNAIKFTEKGYISIGLKKKVINKVEFLRFEVSDTGVGMSQDFLKTMFDKFTQEEEVYTKKQMGTGLGLSIVKKIVGKMKGKINVISNKGMGSIFSIYLPFKYGEKKEEKDYRKHYKLKTTKKALLVEDNEINQIVAINLLEKIGFDIDVVSNGKEAIEYHNENNYDIIFMDIQMPVMDGLEATNIIRQKDIKIPIVAMSASVFKEDIAECKINGMNDHIPKPLEQEVILEKINKYFDLELDVETLSDTYKEKTQNNLKTIDLEKMLEQYKKKEDLIDLYEGFYNDYIEKKNNIIEIYEKENNKELLGYLHKVKGLTGNLRIMGLYSLIVEMEKEVIEGKDIGYKINEYLILFEEVLNEIKLNILTIDKKVEKEDINYKDLLKEIKRKIENFECMDLKQLITIDEKCKKNLKELYLKGDYEKLLKEIDLII